MKTFLLLPLLFLASLAQASLIGTPYLPEVDARFNKLELGTGIGAGTILEAQLQAPGTANVLGVPRVAKFVWDPSTTASVGTVGAHATGVTIPANAVIRQVWFYTKTSVVSTGNNGTIAVQCNAANDIFSAADIDASTGVAGQIGAGVEVGTAATMLKVSTACNLSVVIAVNAFTAGKMDWFVEYVVAE